MKKKGVKIIIGLIMIALIGSMSFVINAIVGNPISAMIADRGIKQYVSQTYPEMDLEIEKASYNFKNGTYWARVSSKDSMDTKFYISYGNGKIQGDSYEHTVLGMFNTLDRLSREYSVVAKEVIDKHLGYENSSVTVMFDKDEYENIKDSLALDMAFDKTLPLRTEVTIGLNLMDNSLESIAKILTDVHKVFIDNEYIFSKYDLYVEKGEMLVMLNGVTPMDIESGELIERLEKAKDNDGANGISFFTKGENK